MSPIDFILNIAGLLLWLNWRAAAMPIPRQPGAPLLSTIRPAGPMRPKYRQWAGLPILLVARAFFYWQVGPPVHWNPQLPLGPTALSFRSDLLGRMLLYSLLSFAASLGACYLWLLFLSVVNGRSEADPIQRLVRAWLGKIDRWPVLLKLIVPIGAAALAWLGLHPLLLWLTLVPSSPVGGLLAQGALIGVAAFLSLKFLLAALLVLYLINSYVYLGEFALWQFVNNTTRRLLQPWQWLPLRAGKIDLTPVLLLAVVWGLAELARRGLDFCYARLM